MSSSWRRDISCTCFSNTKFIFSVFVIQISIFFRAVRAASSSHFSKQIFLQMKHDSPSHLHVRPDRDLNVISLETRAAALRPFRPPLYLIPSVCPHFFSSRWLLMRLPSNLLSVNRPPTKYWEHFFHLLRLERATESVRRHYALAHNPQKECRRIAVFNQTEDDRWDDCSRQITSSVSNRALI